MPPSPRYHNPSYLYFIHNEDDSPELVESSNETVSHVITQPDRSSSSLYYQHIVLPSDTIQGICLRYKISARSLGQINRFSGRNLGMAPKILWIPKIQIPGVVEGASGMNEARGKAQSDGVILNNIQDQTSQEFMLYYVMATMDDMTYSDAFKCCEMHDWDLEQLISLQGSKDKCYVDTKLDRQKNESKENHYNFRVKVCQLEQEHNPWIKMKALLEATKKSNRSIDNVLIQEYCANDVGIEMTDFS